MFGALYAIGELIRMLEGIKPEKYNKQPDLSDKNWKKLKDGRIIYIEPKSK